MNIVLAYEVIQQFNCIPNNVLAPKRTWDNFISTSASSFCAFGVRNRIKLKPEFNFP